jgi:hypothetical protein
MEKKNLENKSSKPKTSKSKKTSKKKVDKTTEKKVEKKLTLDVDKKYRMIGTGVHQRCPQGKLISVNGRVAQIFLDQGYAKLEK